MLAFIHLCFQPTKELIREIATLELEVMHLEQYLLTLYRRAFDQQTPTLSSQPELLHESAKFKLMSKRTNSNFHSSRAELHQKWTANSANDDFIVLKWQDKLLDPAVQRSQSSLSQRATCSARISPSEESLARALHSFHSQPLSYNEVSYLNLWG